jgi:hypothetical protein
MSKEKQRAYKENLPYSFEDPLDRVHRVQGMNEIQGQLFDVIIVDGVIDIASLPRHLKAGGVFAASVGAVSFGLSLDFAPRIQNCISIIWQQTATR